MWLWKTCQEIYIFLNNDFNTASVSMTDLYTLRKEFYLRNGFYETNKYYIDAGIKYELLCTNKDYKITEELLRKRYSNMSNSKIVRYIIGKTVNMNNIKFIR